eukprot:499303_1
MTYMSRYAVKQKQTNLHTNEGNNRGFQEATMCHVSNMLVTHNNRKKRQKEIDCMVRIIEYLHRKTQYWLHGTQTERNIGIKHHDIVCLNGDIGCHQRTLRNIEYT